MECCIDLTVGSKLLLLSPINGLYLLVELSRDDSLHHDLLLLIQNQVLVSDRTIFLEDLFSGVLLSNGVLAERHLSWQHTHFFRVGSGELLSKLSLLICQIL